MRDRSQVIVIGASAGGVEALLTIVAGLAPSLAAPVLVVLHIGAHRSYLPQLLSARGPNPAVFAQDGASPEPGIIYVAPPDYHLLLQNGALRIVRGPKEHHARPAINPLFRSAALDLGPRVVGVILTGMLDDGSAGLKAIKDCGGITVVQDPSEAIAPSMPRSALQSVVDVDHILKVNDMGPLLSRLAVALGDVPDVDPPETLRIEHAISLGAFGLEELKAIAAPSAFTCPDCGGSLFEVQDSRPLRFLCHTGHAFSLRSLASTHRARAEEALWSGLRVLQEKQALLKRVAEVQKAHTPGSENAALEEAEQLNPVISAMQALVRIEPGTENLEAPSGLMSPGGEDI